MMSKCPFCKKVTRINEHRVFLQHTTTKMDMSKGKMVTKICKGSFIKANLNESN